MPRIQQGNPENLKRRRTLRAEMTRAENKLWLRLRGKQFEGVKFRRQHGIGSYIVDFYCPEKLIVVEVDGDVHAEDAVQGVRDLKRDTYLSGLGLRVIRYMNDEVLNNLEGVLEDLNTKLFL